MLHAHDNNTNKERLKGMFKEQLLDYQAEKEYLLIRILYINNYSLDKKTICKKLKTSYPTLKKIVERTNAYFKEYYPKEKIELTMNTHDIYFQETPNIPVDNLTFSFFTNSDKYILLDLLYKHPHLSRTVLANKLNISDTSLNVLISQCNDLLKEFDLRIRNGDIEGSSFQYLYFYLLFYWSTNSTPINLETLNNHEINEWFSKNYGKTIGLIEQKKLSLWLVLLREKKKKLSSDSINSSTVSYVPNVQDTKLFQDLKVFFKQNWKEISYDEIDNVAYVTFLFLNSFEILDRKIIDLHSIHINDQRNLLVSKVLILLQQTFHIDSLYNLVHTNLFYLLGRLLFFKGAIYTIDKITLNYYLTQYKSDFEDSSVNKIIQAEPTLEQKFNQQQLSYFKHIIYSLIFLLKRYNKNTVKIALLLDTSPFLATTFSTKLDELFYNNPSIQIEMFVAEKQYDLIITNIKCDQILKTREHFFISNLGSKTDLKKIVALIDKISLGYSL